MRQLYFLLMLMLVSSALAATPNPGHDASRIGPGIFPEGDFTFNGSLRVMNTSGSTHFHINSSNGNLGIGTTSPGQKFTVGDGTQAVFAQIHSSNSNIFLGQSGLTRFGYAAGQTGLVLESAAGQNLSVGTLGAGDLTFGTDNTARMTIEAATGNVGIATLNPAQKLEVNGSANITSITYTPQICLNGDCRTAWPAIAGSSSAGGWTNTSTLVSLSNSANNISADVLFVDNTNDRVGIGSTSPGEKLSVRGGHGTTISLTNTDGSNARTFFTTSSNGGNVWGGIVAVDGNQLRLGVDNDMASPAITIQSGTYGTKNNVGIGTTTPAAKLQIDDNVTTITDEADYAIKITDGASATGLLIGVSPANNGGILQALDPGTTWSKNIILQPNGGNVGIGETAPSNKLTVGVSDSSTTYATSAVMNVFNSDTTVNNSALIAFGQTGAASNSFSRFGVVYRDRTGSSEDQDFYWGTIGAGVYSEKMRLTSTGNLGVGTTDPVYRLTVSAPSTMMRLHSDNSRLAVYSDTAGETKILAFNAAESGDGAIFLGRYTTTTPTLYLSSGGYVGVGTAAPTAALHINSSNTLGSLNVQNTSNSHLFVNGTSGRVGVGTTEPATQLHVYHPSTSATVRVQGTNSQYSLINDVSTSARFVLFSSSNAGSLAGVAIANWTSLDHSGTGGLIIGTNTAGLPVVLQQGGTEIIRLTGGNVGLGTTSPTTKLHVVGSLNVSNTVSDQFLVRADSNGLGFSEAYLTGQGMALAMYGNPQGTTQTGNGGLSYSASTAGIISDSDSPLVLGAGASEKMRITTSGLVGIGTTNPGQELQVNGEVIINSTANDSAVATALNVNGAFITIGDQYGNLALGNGAGIKFHDSGVAHSSIKYLTSSDRMDFCGSSSNSVLSCTGTPTLSLLNLNSNPGNVGIGDSTPTNKLDVAGAIGISDITIIDASRNWATHFIPAADGIQDLGNSSRRWGDAYFEWNSGIWVRTTGGMKRAVYGDSGASYLWYDVDAAGARFDGGVAVGPAAPGAAGTITTTGNINGGGSVSAAAGSYLAWTGRSHMASPSDGVITLTNGGITDFARLQFGGTTSSFPALRRSGANLDVVTADASAWSRLQVSGVTMQSGEYLYLDGGSNTGIRETAADTIEIITGGAQRATISNTQYSILNSDLSVQSTERLYIDGGGDTYIYEPVANRMNLVVGGTAALQLDANFVAMQSGAELYLDGGSNTYIEESAADTISVVTGGTQRAIINGSGFVGLSATPDRRLHVSGTTRMASGTANLVTNSYMSGDISGWTDNSGPVSSISYNSGLMRLDGATDYARADQTLTFVAGTSYLVSIYVATLPGGTNVQLDIGTSAGGTQYLSEIMSSTGVYTFAFTATGTSGGIRVWSGWNGVDVDNIIVYPIGAYIEGRVGIGDSTPDAKLDVVDTSVNDAVLQLEDSSGVCNAQPSTTGLTWSCSSDERLKKDITPASPALDYLLDIPLYDYTVIKTNERVMGPVAQRMKEKHPELVREASDGLLSVSEPSTWQLVRGIQELNEKIEAKNAGKNDQQLEARIAQLEQELANATKGVAKEGNDVVIMLGGTQ